MKTLKLVQGTPEWEEHRANHFNASDAPAMLGCSIYTTRNDLIKSLATGFKKEINSTTQRIFDDGHRFEALARPIAEEIIGDELYPVIGTEGKLSASYDGLTMMEDIAFEHKSLNDELRAIMTNICTGADLPKMYRVQMEQQHMVSGCEKILFMASKWNGDELVEERHCWYTPDAELREEISQGWTQFAIDLENYQYAEEKAPLVAAPIVDLPSVSVQVKGEIAIVNNFDVFEVALRDFIDNRLIRKPQTDQDFADLDTQIKALKKAEDALVAAEAAMVAQVSSIDTMKRAKDMLYKLARDNRLMAEKLLEAEKTNRRVAIQDGGKNAFAEHVAALNIRLGKPYMPAIPADFVGVTKGKRTITSIQDAVDTELARAKIAANATADSIDMNLKSLRELAANHAFLFADTAQLVLKSNDDLVNVIKLRINEHEATEKARIEAEVAKRLAEEKAAEEKKLRDEAEARAKDEQREREAEAAAQARAQRDLEQHNKTAMIHEANEMPALTTERVGEVMRDIASRVNEQSSDHPVTETPKIYKRPCDAELIDILADSLDVPVFIAAKWIKEINPTILEELI